MLEESASRPVGLSWRCSSWFTTIVVGLGITTDLLVYSMIIPVLPFQLQELGYNGVSGLVGWLLFAYSAGLAVFTIPIAVLSERWGSRRWPLIVGLLVLVGSQIMMMEAPTYWVMCLARIIQGFASSIVWVLGLALLCDCTPPSSVGRQLGFAMMGLSVGSIIGPPVGGALYTRFGFRGPFIFGIGVCVADLIGRLVIVERKDALRWGIDPAAEPDAVEAPDAEARGEGTGSKTGHKNCATNTEAVAAQGQSASLGPEGTPAIANEESMTSPQASPSMDAVALSTSNVASAHHFSAMQVLHKLRHSPRALVTVVMTLVWGIAYSAQEPTLPLHLADQWGFNSSKVGLIYLAGVIPTLFSSPITGWYTDRRGAEWAISWSLLLGIPWWVVITIDGHIALFIVAYCFENLFVSGVVSPLTAELAAVARDIEGVGYAHVYGAFNLAYGIGSSVGPVVGGQMYDHLQRGWMAVCLLAMGLTVMSLVLAFCYTGDRPLGARLLRVMKRRELEATQATSDTQATEASA
ncbi:major facilitator superfamily domain-containing protein [Schizophyllum amplum]|uniref:Major facilitator superfamily domain-containing protein n=1 Tax=Schizophyllum amplum TaxID=97359 RepID=A0A550CDW2_9AGAR|nr:major facilitator superfamily domain-containing protein [Auriculariopsis ampla]